MQVRSGYQDGVQIMSIYIAVHLQVRTRVAVRLGHSAVSTNTADMQRYWEQN